MTLLAVQISEDALRGRPCVRLYSPLVRAALLALLIYTNGCTEGLYMEVAVGSVDVMLPLSYEGFQAGLCIKQDASCVQCVCCVFRVLKNANQCPEL